MSNLTIGRVAKAAGVNVETVRFYERKGLITQPEKPAVGGPRDYGSGDGHRFIFLASHCVRSGVFRRGNANGYACDEECLLSDQTPMVHRSRQTLFRNTAPFSLLRD